MTLFNNPSLWLKNFPRIQQDDHKYDRGVAVIFGAPKMTGATRLAAMACARIGAGLVKVVAPEGTGVIYRETLPAHIIVEDEDALTVVSDPRVRAVLVGPGWSYEDACDRLPLLKEIGARQNVSLVMDAGAFLALGELQTLSANLVVTPHEGEFARVFPELAGSKSEKALEAARRIAGIVVLKGADTIITDGRQVVENHADAPQLATAGTGDVLAGMIAGLVAQGMPLMEASCASVWIHAEVARRFGQGLVASDLPERIPAVLQDLSR